MKQKHTITSLSVLLGITLMLSVFLSGFSSQEEATETEEQKTVITNIHAGEVQAVALTNASGSIGLFSTSGGILVDGEEQSNYSQERLITLVYTLSHMSAERTLSNPQADSSVYGLHQPLAQASILLPDDTIRLLLGRKSPISDEYYLQLQGNPAIYLIDGDTAGEMLTSVQDLRDLAMYPALTRETLKELFQLSITGPEDTILLRQLSTDTISSFFGMFSPVEAALDWKNVDDQILNPLCNLTPRHFVSDNRPLSDYGLDAPDYTLELVLGNQIYTCGFSQKNQDSWYAANLATTLVSEVDAADIEFLKTDFMDLIGNSIYTFSPADASSISANYETNYVSMKLSGISEQLTGTIEERQLDSVEVMNFCRKIDAIPAASLWEETDSITSDPSLTMTITLRKGGEEILEFYPVGDRRCAVFINGSCEFTTYTTVVEDIKKTFEGLK